MRPLREFTAEFDVADIQYLNVDTEAGGLPAEAG